jgi:hypothetical protein
MFIGDIKKCVEYHLKSSNLSKENDNIGFGYCRSEVVKKHAILLKVAENKYIDFDYFTCCKDYKDIVKCVSSNTPLDDIILCTFATHREGLFVDTGSLKSVYEIEQVPDKFFNKSFVQAAKRSNMKVNDTSKQTSKKLVKTVKKNK